MTNGEYMKVNFTHEQRLRITCLAIALTDVSRFSAWLDEEHMDGKEEKRKAKE